MNIAELYRIRLLLYGTTVQNRTTEEVGTVVGQWSDNQVVVHWPGRPLGPKDFVEHNDIESIRNISIKISPLNYAKAFIGTGRKFCLNAQIFSAAIYLFSVFVGHNFKVVAIGTIQWLIVLGFCHYYQNRHWIITLSPVSLFALMLGVPITSLVIMVILLS